MDASILALLEEHGSLAYDQIAVMLDERADNVRDVLTRLRERGLADVLAVGELEGHRTRPASYWRLTDAGRAELARLRRG